MDVLDSPTIPTTTKGGGLAFELNEDSLLIGGMSSRNHYDEGGDSSKIHKGMRNTNGATAL